MIGRGEKVLLTCCRVEIASPGGTNGAHFQTTERAVGFSSAGDKSARTVQSVQPLIHQPRTLPGRGWREKGEGDENGI